VFNLTPSRILSEKCTYACKYKYIVHHTCYRYDVPKSWFIQKDAWKLVYVCACVGACTCVHVYVCACVLLWPMCVGISKYLVNWHLVHNMLVCKPVCILYMFLFMPSSSVWISLKERVAWKRHQFNNCWWMKQRAADVNESKQLWCIAEKEQNLH